MNNFPQWNIGTVRGIDFEFEVHWVEPDLAQLTLDGDVYTSFCSNSPEGFLNVDDVIDQAQDVVYEYDADWLDSDAEW